MSSKFAFAVVALSLVAPTAPAAARVGALTQLPGKAGCMVQRTAPAHVRRECETGRFAKGPLAASPDGRNLYVAGDGISVLRVEHGRLHQLSGKAGCLNSTGKFGCKRVPRLSGATTDLTVSPDGRSVYLGSSEGPYGFGTVLIFNRQRSTGALRLAACLGDPQMGCGPARGVYAGVTKVLVSRDERTVYVASQRGTEGVASEGAIAVFSREPNGRLSQLPGPAGCLDVYGTDGCTEARGLDPACCGMAASPDWRNVYISSSAFVVTPYPSAPSGALALAAFSRSTSSGALTQLPGAAGCVNKEGGSGCAAAAFSGDQTVNQANLPIVSPDGRDVYLAHSSPLPQAEFGPCGYSANFVALLSRDPGSGALGPLRQDLSACGSAALMSPDGRSLYTSTDDFGSTVGILSRNRTTGTLATAGCVGHLSPGCREVRHMDGPEGLAMAGRYLYVLSSDVVEGDGITITVFKRALR